MDVGVDVGEGTDLDVAEGSGEVFGAGYGVTRPEGVGIAGGAGYGFSRDGAKGVEMNNGAGYGYASGSDSAASVTVDARGGDEPDVGEVRTLRGDSNWEKICTCLVHPTRQVRKLINRQMKHRLVLIISFVILSTS